jgi:VWFA-related protein
LRIDVKGHVRGLSTLLLLVFAAGLVAVAQNYQVRTNVDLVVVPVTVRGDNGKLIAGLTQKDFSITEDQVPQTISNFSDDPQPLSAAIVIDTGMGGISLRRLVPLFITVTNGFSEFDEMAAFRYDHLVFQLSDFTSDHEKIEKSLEVVKTIAAKQPATVPAGSAAPTAPKIIQLLLGSLGGYGGAVDANTRPPTETLPTTRPRRVDPSRSLYDGLYDAAKALETRPRDRRRIIFIVSDGQVSGSSEHNFEEITSLLLRDDIELYAVTTDYGAFEGRFGVLGALARATGGDEYRGLTTAAMESAFGRITEQARNQYVLGYHSTNKVPGESQIVRTIQVTGRDPKWKIVHRKGYVQVP